MEKIDKEFEDALAKSLKTIGGNLKRLREAAEKDLTEVAKAVQIKAEVLETIEEGTHEIRVSQLARLCAYYNVTPVDLFKYSEA
ncbi:helix-turn-helix domain-containing protein [Fulvivirgaceae bacterium PWU5]|uniref:Helix-turn-helix domain-containing protein n=1 Tax=Dawidia cretensis TaxID=2782350 RepID=A0AAP2DXB8_9BACT|nr:helix-turn-helix transcriptional regulator [Dawidia cretensis]MBT1707747.1 helix-turn-helix domain-containing protein [Dawidia cretensis]